MEQLRHPIGTFELPDVIDSAMMAGWIDEIEALPARLRQVVGGMADAQLETAYRDGGWTVRQVVHHLCDGHGIAYGIFKLALTEENPAVMPYDEAKWAMFVDARTAPISWSLDALAGVHARWVMALRATHGGDFARTFQIADSQQPVRLDHFIGWHAWHGKHHLAQIALVG